MNNLASGPPEPPDYVGLRISGGNLDDLRRRNLSSVLEVVHTHGACSRSDITSVTELNRSTVKGLVEDLVAAGILKEGVARKSGVVGRPSPTVEASDSVRVLAVHPEIDATVGAIVGLNGKVFERAVVRHSTIPTPEEFLDAVQELSSKLDSASAVCGMGVAVPGLVNRQTGTVVLAPHLGWEDIPLASLLAKSFDGIIAVDNDANCGVIAEAMFGSGRGFPTVAYLNGGASGIGGSVAHNNRLAVGSHGFGGEYGHTLVNSAGQRCQCGASGCLETEVSRAQLLAALGDIPATELEEELFSQCAGPDPSPRAVAEVDRQLGFLGIAIRNVVNAQNPDRLVLGGFLAELITACGTGRIEQELACALPGSRSDVEIVATELGHDILIVGAAELVLRQVIADPLAIHQHRV